MGIYTVFDAAGVGKSMELEKLDLFERDASADDIILIDNVDNIRTKADFKWIVRAIKKWKESGKAVVVSSRQSLGSNQLPELKDKN